jgi:hypothetical protein
MASRLLNVRLDEKRLGKARKLREAGLTLADVVREAIDVRYEALGLDRARDAAAAVARIHQRFPDPGGLPDRGYDVHDRRAAAAAIGRALKRRPR